MGHPIRGQGSSGMSHQRARLWWDIPSEGKALVGCPIRGQGSGGMSHQALVGCPIRGQGSGGGDPTW